MDIQKSIKTMVDLIWFVLTEKAFFTFPNQRRYKLWSCKNVCDALFYVLDKIYVYIQYFELSYTKSVEIPVKIAPLL